MERGGTQFITYKGIINGSFRQTTHAHRDANVSCYDWTFDGLDNSFFQVGVNPNWDSNGFWFGIKRPGAPLESHEGSCENRTLDAGGCTDDPIYNLDVSSADYPSAIWDLMIPGAATQVDDTSMEGGQGYNVDDTGAGLDLGGNRAGKVSIQRPLDFSYNEGCYNQTVIRLGYGIPRVCFYEKETRLTSSSDSDTAVTNYNFTFTNLSVKAELEVHGYTGELAISFSGNRTDDTDDQFETVQAVPYNNGEYTPIALNTTDPYKPNFMFTNGSGFEFKETDNHTWYAVTSSAMPSFQANSVVLSMWASITAMGYILFF